MKQLLSVMMTVFMVTLLLGSFVHAEEAASAPDTQIGPEISWGEPEPVTASKELIAKANKIVETEVGTDYFKQYFSYKESFVQYSTCTPTPGYGCDAMVHTRETIVYNVLVPYATHHSQYTEETLDMLGSEYTAAREASVTFEDSNGNKVDYSGPTSAEPFMITPEKAKEIALSEGINAEDIDVLAIVQGWKQGCGPMTALADSGDEGDSSSAMIRDKMLRYDCPDGEGIQQSPYFVWAVYTLTEGEGADTEDSSAAMRRDQSSARLYIGVSDGVVYHLPAYSDNNGGDKDDLRTMYKDDTREHNVSFFGRITNWFRGLFGREPVVNKEVVASAETPPAE